MAQKLLSVFILTLFVVSSFAGITLDQANSNGTVQLGFTQDGYTITDIATGGGEFKKINAEGCEGITLVKGAPEVPFTATAIAIAKGATPTLSISNAVYEEVALEGLLPSVGNVTRDVDIATRKREEGAAYSVDAWFPSTVAELGDPYITQGVSGVALIVHPFQYNPVTGVLRVLKSADFSVSTDGAPELSKRVVNSISRRTMLKDRFINGAAALQNTRYTPVEAGDRMIVITPSKYEDAIAPLVEWKNKKGINTTVHIYGDEVSSGATGVQSFIKEKYSSDAISYVILVGDWEDIPSIMTTYQGQKTETVSCDPKFILLEGNDKYPDAFIGRISVSSASQVTDYVNKVLTYEMNPQKGGKWYEKAVSIGSNEGNPKDYDWLRDSINTELEDYGYTSIDGIYQGLGGTVNDFSNYVNDGRGLVNFMGHGNNDGFGFQSGFWYGQSHINSLVNGEMLPVIIPLACNLGQMKGRTCAAEAWTQNKDGGAIVIMASSPLMDWSPPQISQVEQNRLLVAERHISVGATFYNGQMKMLDASVSSGTKSLESWNYFGDPSLVMFSKSPKDMTVTHDENFTTGANTLEVSAEDGAIVCVYSETNGILGTAEVKSGKASVSFEATDEAELYLTVTALNCMPYMGKITAGSSDPFVTVTAPNGGEKISLEDTYEIKWSDNVDEKATITLIKDGEKVKELAKDVDGGSYSWSVNDVDAADGYKIVVKCGDIADTSDATFLIKESSWSKNLVSATQWAKGCDDYEEEENKSSVTMEVQSREPMVTASFKIGKMDAAKEIYPWANISAYLASNFEGVTAVKVYYKADKAINLTLDQEELMEAGTSYYVELPSTGGDWKEVITEVSSFKQPSWVKDKSDLDLKKVKAISFSPVGYGIDANLEIKNARLADYKGDYVSTIFSHSLMASNAPIAIAGFSNGKLSLNLAERGEYKLSIFSVNGRVLRSENLSMTKGLNAIELSSNYSSQVVLLSVEGMGTHLMQKLFIK